jgi:phospholipid transport system substrate-binding protein
MLRTIITSLLLAPFVLPASALADNGGGTEIAATESTETTEAGPAEEAAGGVSALDEFKRRHEVVMLLVKSKMPREAIEKQVDEVLDYDWIGVQSLGGKSRADRRCGEKCADFDALLTRLIRENYLKRITQAEDGTVEYVGEEKRARASKVTTKVKFKKDGVEQTITVAYVMHVVDGKWQVRDIITEGVSLAKNYRFEFGKILRDEGIDGLIKRLETKLADIAKTE